MIDRDKAKDLVEFTAIELGFDKPSVEIGLCDEGRFWAKINGKWHQISKTSNPARFISEIKIALTP